MRSRGGYIIKVDGKYYVYLKDAAHADNVRTKDEINRQNKNMSKIMRRSALMLLWQRSQGRYTTDDGYVLIQLILSKIRVMLISFLMEVTITIFQKVIYLPVS